MWPHSGFCLDIRPTGLTHGRHMLCIDQGYSDPEMVGWCEQIGWQLNGLLLFQRSETHFEVIPLIAANHNTELVMCEMQLTFTRGEGGWTFKQSNLGPVNAMFHAAHMAHYMKGDEPALSRVQENIDQLGNVISLCLGTLYAKLSDPRTSYDVSPAKEPKVKRRSGKVVKVYRHARVGHLEII